MKGFARHLLLGASLLLGLNSPAVLAEELAQATVERVQLPRVYHLDGVIEATNRSTISAQTSGQVREVLFDVDDLVEQGSVIVVLDDVKQRAALNSAEASVKAAKAQRAEAAREYERIKAVFAKQAVSKSAMDKATAALKSTSANQDAAEAALAQATQQLEYTRITAPYTGIVTERFIEVGEVAAPGQRLMSGISLQQLRVAIDVPQSLIKQVRENKDAKVWLNGRWLQATGVTVFPVADSATDTFRVRLQLPEGEDYAFPGMYVKAALAIGTRNALVVPKSAVAYRSEVVGVYVIGAEGRISLRHVRVGEPLPDDLLPVLSGLDAGEQVALDPHAAVLALKAQREERAGNE